MIVSALRPYFCPYPGFFYQAYRSDALVILDEVQFPRRTTWVSRNRFKNDQGTLWLTIPVWKKGLGLQKISQVRICYEGRWPRKHLESLKTAYSHAPYLAEHLPFLEEMFSRRHDRLLDLNLAIISYLLDSFQFGPELLRLSDLGITARGTGLLVEICRALGASVFLIQSPAERHLETELFQEAGVELRAFRYKAPVYPQLWGDFLPDLAAFDLILNCGPKARDILLRHQPGNG